MSDSVTAAHEAVLEELLDARYSCRAFRDRQVDRGTIERLVTLAQRSPSWCNTQPWHLHITEGSGTERFRQAVTDYARSHSEEPDFPFPERYEGDFQARRRACAWQLYGSVGVVKGDREASGRQALENFNLFGAPHVAIVTTERALGVYGAVDCGLYLGCFLLAAQSLGVATVAQAALAGVAPAVREFFALPDHRQVLFGVSFGYADDDHPANGFRTARQDPGEVVSWVTD